MTQRWYSVYEIVPSCERSAFAKNVVVLYGFIRLIRQATGGARAVRRNTAQRETAMGKRKKPKGAGRGDARLECGDIKSKVVLFRHCQLTATSSRSRVVTFCPSCPWSPVSVCRGGCAHCTHSHDAHNISSWLVRLPRHADQPKTHPHATRRSLPRSRLIHALRTSCPCRHPTGTQSSAQAAARSRRRSRR